MQNPLLSMVALTLALALGCKGCDDGLSASASPQREQQNEQTQLRTRLAARKLDRNKAYPKGEDGVIACGADTDCFLIQGERCSTAVVTHGDTFAGYGLEEHVEARYRITGSDGEKCRLVRETLAIDAKLDPHLVTALKKQGKSEQELAQVKDTALETLRAGNPARFECSLSADQMLEAGLNLAEGRYDTQFWRLACNEASAPPRPQ
jgi:hypothetical protein